MKSNIHKQRARIAQFGFVVFALFGFSQMAQAATLGADHVIQNQVSVDFLDAGGLGVGGTATAYNETATVDITVNLVQAAPQVTNVTTDTLDPVSTSQSVTLIFEITSNANGVDDYNLENPLLTDTTDTPSGASTIGAPSPDPLSLGATSFAGGSSITFDTGGVPSSTAITVPMDSTAADDLSGFSGAGTEVLVFRATGTTGAATAGDVVCTVTGITDGALVNDTATITIATPCDSGGVEREVLEGDQIGERATISIVITAGADAGVMDFTADINNTDDNDTTPTGPVSITVVAADLDVFKFVRNTDGANNPACGAAAFSCLTAGGDTYYATGVTANPGDTLQYAILLFNQAGLVTSVTVTDPLVLFTTYVGDTASNTGDTVDLIAQGTAADGGLDCDTATTGTCVVTETGTDVTTFVYYDDSTSTITVSGGHDGFGVAVGDTNGGQLDIGEVSVVFFDVTVDG
jgi:hypothetical protein